MLIFAKRERAFYYAYVGLLHSVFTGTLKSIYHAPRPYMVDSNIRAYDCNSGYGLPSGHASGITVILLTLFVDYFYFSDNSQNS